MCDVLIRNVIDRINALDETDLTGSNLYLPPIMLFTDLNCSGGMYSVSNLVSSTNISYSMGARLNDSGNWLSSIEYDRNLQSYRNLTTFIDDIMTITPSNTESATRYYYLPKKPLQYTFKENKDKSKTYNVVLPDFFDTSKSVKSMIVPSQYSKIVLEGILGHYWVNIINNFKYVYNDARRMLKSEYQAPFIGEDLTRFKPQYVTGVNNQSWVPLASYYTEHWKTSLVTMQREDVWRYGYDTDETSPIDNTPVDIAFRLWVYRKTIPGSTTTIKSAEDMIRESCMGLNTIQLGVYTIERYLPQSPFCDRYMTRYCAIDANKSIDACACFKDWDVVQQLSINTGVSLPVTCFGERCPRVNAYKTLDMKKMPCNTMLCRQIISSLGDSVNVVLPSVGNNMVQCNGEYFSSKGQLSIINQYYNDTVNSTPVVEALQTVEVTKVESSLSDDRLDSPLPAQPFWAWILLAFAFVLAIVFAILYMFPAPLMNLPPPNNNHNVPVA